MNALAISDYVTSGPVLQLRGRMVDVQGGSVHPVRLRIRGSRILSIERDPSAPSRFILPGLIDAHIHIESSLLTPARFAEKAVVHGTTAVVADPHEIANVAGMEGIKYMLDNAASVPLRFHFTVPSCVPVSPLETTGGVITARDASMLFQDPRFVALGEVMDHNKVLNDDPDTMAKIDAAVRAGRPVDGHCPGLRGEDLDRYIMVGITTEHEAASLEEAEEKARKGMTIMVREGSAAQNFKALLPFARNNPHFLVTDDLEAEDLVQGHMDAILRKAVAEGMDAVQAIRAVTMWPAQHYGVPGGWIRPDGPADLVVVSDLQEFKVEETWIRGIPVARNGQPLFTGGPLAFPRTIGASEVQGGDMTIPAKGSRLRVRVIVAKEGEIDSGSAMAELDVIDGRIASDHDCDCLHLAVVNRYRPAPPALAFIRGFCLKEGALASSVAHDAHNIIAVGVDGESMAHAVNEIIRMGGGMYAGSGQRKAVLPLPVAGLMSDLPVDEVVRKERELHELAREMGCPLRRPFMTLSFQSLLVVPSLKLGDRGLMDTLRSEAVEAIIAT
jgi:adenine deaminase